MWWVLFIIGLIFVCIEVFIPGFGVFGISGATFMIVSSFFLLDTPFGMFFLIVSILSAILIIFIIGILIYKAFKKEHPKFLKNTLFLQKSLKTQDGYTSSYQNDSHIGEIMIVDTFLRPSGKVSKDGIIYDAMSENKFIDKGKSVKVIGNKGSILIVREI